MRRYIIALVVLAFVAGTGWAQTWHETYHNLRIKGTAQVQGTLDVDGTTDFAGTVTHNSTVTNDGVVQFDNTRQHGRISWLTSYDPPNDNPKTVSGLSMPDAEYSVLFAPTTGITINAFTVIDSDSFSVSIEGAPASNVSQTYFVIPGEY